MSEHDEKRDYVRIPLDCEINYRLADGQQIKTGRCKNLSAAGLSFITDQPFDLGLAMEVSIAPKTAFSLPMNAFIELVRCIKLENGDYEIAATIKSIKGV